MIRDLRMAGSGFSGRPLTTGGLPGNRLFAVHPAPGAGSEADTLYLVGCFDGIRSQLTAPLAGPGDPITVASSAEFAAGDLVVVTNGIAANLFEVTADPGLTGILVTTGASPYNNTAAHAQWPSGGYSVGALAVRVDRVAYWIEEVDGERRVMRRLNQEDPSAVAFNVEDLDVSYVLLDGSITQDPPDPSFITSITLTYVATTSHGEQDTVSVDVRPRVFS
jgi:hypothetical protein